MHILKGVQRIFSVRAAAAQNLISDKSCGRERFTMRMCAAAKYSRKGAVVGLYTQHGPPPCSRMPPKSCVHSEASKSDAVALQKKVAATAVCVMSIRSSCWPNGSEFI